VTAHHTVRSLAKQVGGVVLGEGEDTVITGVNDLRAAGPSEISFLANSKYEKQARDSRAGAILVSRQEVPQLGGTLVQVESPSAAFAHIAKLFAPAPIRHEPGVHASAVVAPDAHLGLGVSIQPNAVIGARVRIGAGTVIGAGSVIGPETTIGEHCFIDPLVLVRERCVIGSRVILHGGVVIGGDGFGYEFRDGQHVKIEHTGIVQIDDDVEIGANSTVDRARFGKTHIGAGAKIDNLVMIAHNVVVGPLSIVVAQTGISGSTTLGRGVVLAGQVGLAGHLHVGAGATVTAQSGITKDVPPGVTLSGRHARPIREALKIEVLEGRLPEIVERLKALEEKLRQPGGPTP
jgi:UDP-3-O-[3-hydroxymyristoyl] glucosamine N-acyltransferase